MPYAHRGPKRWGTYKNIEAIRLAADKVLAEINSVVVQVVDETTRAAYQVALAKVPVRKVFKGGRSHSRPLSIQELMGEHTQYLRSLSVAQQREHMARERLGISSPFSVGARYGTRTATARDRENLWHATSEHRLLTLSVNDQYRLANPLMERRLNPRGRYELQNANRPVQTPADVMAGATHIPHALRRERHAVSIDAGGNLRLGGSLRSSLRIELRDDAKAGRVENAVSAGGRKAPYAHYVEFGTRHAPAQPFLRPALKHVERTYGDRMEKALRRRFGII